MLVLTRKPEEKIVIGEDQKIVITILKIQGDKVSVGIKAPDKIPIYREELLKKEIEQSNQRGAVNKQMISTKEIVADLQNKIKCGSDQEDLVLETPVDA